MTNKAEGTLSGEKLDDLLEQIDDGIVAKSDGEKTSNAFYALEKLKEHLVSEPTETRAAVEAAVEKALAQDRERIQAYVIVAIDEIVMRLPPVLAGWVQRSLYKAIRQAVAGPGTGAGKPDG